MKGDPVLWLVGSLALQESTWGLVSLESASGLGPWELAGTGVAWEPGVIRSHLELVCAWFWAKVGTHFIFCPQYGYLALGLQGGVTGNSDYLSYNLNMSLIFMPHPDIIIPYPESLALRKLFLCVDSYTN